MSGRAQSRPFSWTLTATCSRLSPGPYPTARPKPGHVEQDPRDWMEGVLAALDGFAKAHDLGGLLGIGLCSQVNTHVFVDDDGRTAAARRSSGRMGAAGTTRRRSTPRLRPNRRWPGSEDPCRSMRAMRLARMAHVARTLPDLYARTRYVLLPKDYCALKLTGAVATDPISSVGLVDSDAPLRGRLDWHGPGRPRKACAALRLHPLRRQRAQRAPLRRHAGLCRSDGCLGGNVRPWRHRAMATPCI